MLKNILTLITGLVLLILGFMFSLIALAIIAVIGFAVWAYLWWKTRKLRQAMREQATRGTPSDGQVIEGESVVVEEFHVRTTSGLPDKTSRIDT
jgi:UPF0716 family protein affecting phage T7 exclusion